MIIEYIDGKMGRAHSFLVTLMLLYYRPIITNSLRIMSCIDTVEYFFLGYGQYIMNTDRKIICCVRVLICLANIQYSEKLLEINCCGLIIVVISAFK